MRISTQVDQRLVLIWQARQLRRGLIKQLLDAPIESCLVADHRLVQGRGTCLPGRFQQGNKPPGPPYRPTNIQHFHACESYGKDVKVLAIILLLP